MTQTCPQCGREFDRLGHHFGWNPDHRPALTDEQRAVVEFLILRGVYVRDDAAHPRLVVLSGAESWIRDVADELGWLANDPYRQERAKDVAARHDCLEPDDVSGVWAVSTVPHPELGEYEEPTDVTRLRPLTGRKLALEAGEWVGLPLGSLHLDVRGTCRATTSVTYSTGVAWRPRNRRERAMPSPNPRLGGGITRATTL